MFAKFDVIYGELYFPRALIEQQHERKNFIPFLRMQDVIHLLMLFFYFKIRLSVRCSVLPGYTFFLIRELNLFVADPGTEVPRGKPQR